MAKSSASGSADLYQSDIYEWFYEPTGYSILLILSFKSRKASAKSYRFKFILYFSIRFPPKIPFSLSHSKFITNVVRRKSSYIRGWTSAFLLAVHRLCGVIEGRLSHFLPRWLRTGWQSAISQGKINPLKYSAVAGNWTRPAGRTDSELSHWAIMTRGPRGGRTVSYPTELSWPGPRGRQTGSELSHWAIMTRATGRTDSELSHWAIMTWATGRTDSEMHSDLKLI